MFQIYDYDMKRHKNIIKKNTTEYQIEIKYSKNLENNKKIFKSHSIFIVNFTNKKYYISSSWHLLTLERPKESK